MLSLITGATGLLGNNIARLLLARGEAVRVLTRDKNPGKPLAGLQVQQVLGDVRDATAVEMALTGVDRVIHSAGHVHIGWSQLATHEAVNVEGTRIIAAAALRKQIPMTYVSSVNALGLGGKNFEADEETALPGIVACPYVTTKAKGEELVLDHVQRGLHGVIVCPGFMLGPWDWKPSSGRMMLEVTSRFAPLAPSGSFNVCDVRDVAAGTIAAAERGTSGRKYILGGYNLTYFEFWKKLAALAGKRGPLFPAGPMQRAIGAWVGDAVFRITGKESDVNSAGIGMSSQHHRFRSDRAIRELGYTIRPLDETLRDAWNWFVQHGYAKPMVVSRQPELAQSWRTT